MSQYNFIKYIFFSNRLQIKHFLTFQSSSIFFPITSWGLLDLIRLYFKFILFGAIGLFEVNKRLPYKRLISIYGYYDVAPFSFYITISSTLLDQQIKAILRFQILSFNILFQSFWSFLFWSKVILIIDDCFSLKIMSFLSLQSSLKV